MEEHDLISVIVPVHNIEDYLPKCLETLAHQTYEKLEIILVDDGSTDRSGLICDDFAARDPRAKVIHHKENKQQWAARNSGQAAASGEFIMFVDGDDYLHLDTLRTMHEAIHQDGGYDVAIVNYARTVSDTEDIVTERPLEYASLTREVLMEEFFFRWCALWNKLFRRDVIQNTWAHDYERSQDVDYTFRAILNIRRAVWIKSTYYYYRQREGSTVHRQGARLLEAKCLAKLMFDNILHLPTDKMKFQPLLLKKLYETMIVLIEIAWNSPEKKAVISLCQQYETRMHSLFWHNVHLGTIQKTALLLDIKFPHTIRLMKRLTNNGFSWTSLRPFD